MHSFKQKDLYTYLSETPVRFLKDRRYKEYNHNYLHEAILTNDIPSIEVLLLKMPDLCKEVDRIGKTPLHYAIEKKISFTTLKEIAKNSKDVINLADFYLGIAYTYVLMKREYNLDDYLRIGQLFVDNGGNFSSCSKSFIKYPLRQQDTCDIDLLTNLLKLLFQHGAPMVGQYHTLQSLTYKEPTLLNVKAMDNYTLFLEACRFSDISLLDHYVKNGAEFNVATIDGLSPLIMFLTNSELDKAKWYLSLEGVDPTIGYNHDHQNALTMVALYTEENLELFKLLLEAAKRKGVKFEFSKLEFHPQFIGLKRLSINLLKLVFEYDYIDISMVERVDVSEYCNIYLPWKIISNLHIEDPVDECLFLDVDAYGMLIYHSISKRKLSNCYTELFQLLLDYNYPLNLDVMLALLTFIFADWRTPNKVETIFDLLPVESIKQELFENKRLYRKFQHFRLNWNVAHIFRKLSLMPDRLFYMLASANFDIDERLSTYIQSFYGFPFVLKVFLPSLPSNIWHGDAFFAEFTLSHFSTASIPIGSESSGYFYRKLSTIMQDAPAFAKRKFNRFNLKQPSSLIHLTSYVVRKICAKKCFNSVKPFAEQLYDYTPYPFRYRVLSENDYDLDNRFRRMDYQFLIDYLRYGNYKRRLGPPEVITLGD